MDEKPKSLETQPKDVSNEFLRMEWLEFSKFLKNLRGEKYLTIDVSWPGPGKTFSLKAFLEGGGIYWAKKNCNSKSY